jgi:hypothetical protein
VAVVVVCATLLTACDGESTSTAAAAAASGTAAQGSAANGQAAATGGSTVTANAAPSIAGSPATVAVVGQTYIFQPTYSDPNGDLLTFSVSGKPAWLSFNAASGRLTGTPAAKDVGASVPITIVVSDGKSVAQLANFTIAVVSTPSANSLAKTATLSWQAPSTNSDGSALTDLAGYRIHIGTRSRSYTQVISISQADTTRFVVTGLAPGSYYFALTSVDATGVESDYSAETQRTIG